MLSKDPCRSILFKLGIKLGCSPNLISTRLLSDLDKDDMIQGLITEDALEAHIRAWMKSGMPDYAHRLTARMDGIKKEYRNPQTLPQEQSHAYRAPFVDFSERRQDLKA